MTHNRNTSSKPASICLTPTCIHAASEILYNLSPDYPEVDPCTNFDEFVCGGWKDRHDLREDQDDVFTGTLMREHSQLLLRHVLESPYSNKNAQMSSKPAVDEANFNKIQSAYSACMDEDTIKSAGVGPLLRVLRTVEELFPAKKPHAEGEVDQNMLSQARKTLMLQADDQLSRVVVYLTKIGVGGLVDIGVAVSTPIPI